MTTQQRLEGPQHHLSSLSLIGAKKKRITLLSQVRSHVFEHGRFTVVRVCLPLASQVLIGNERKVKVQELTFLQVFSIVLCVKPDLLTFKHRRRCCCFSLFVMLLGYGDAGLHSAWCITTAGKKDFYTWKQWSCVFQKLCQSQYCNPETNYLYLNIVYTCVHYK